MISTSFFDGDANLAGMVMYAIVLLLVFALTRKLQQALIVAIPATLIFSALGVLSTDLTILLIIVTVLCLATTASKWRS